MCVCVWCTGGVNNQEGRMHDPEKLVLNVSEIEGAGNLNQKDEAEVGFSPF